MSSNNVVNVSKCVLNDLNDSIEINLSDCQLPYIDDDMSDDTRIQFFHRCYYSIIVGLAVIDELLIRYGNDYLNQNLDKLFKYYSDNKHTIKDIDVFRRMLIFSRDIYYNECDKYSRGLECGSLLHLTIITINPIRFIGIIKECLGINENFDLIINIDTDISKLSLDTIQDYIKSKYNVGLNVNLFYDKNRCDGCLNRVKVVNF